MRLFQCFYHLALATVSCFTDFRNRMLAADTVQEYRLRGPVITFNSLCLIAGFAILGFANQVTVRYIGTFLATGAYISNWAALSGYLANNITGCMMLYLQ